MWCLQSNPKEHFPLTAQTLLKLSINWLRSTRARLILGLAVSLSLGWLSVRGIEWALVSDQFQEFPVGWVVASLLVVVTSNILRAYRWKILFVGHQVPLLRLFLVQNAGVGLNNMVPVRVLSEGVQFALMTLRYKVNGGAVLGTMGIERILDMVITASLLMVGLTLLPSKGEVLPYVIGAFVFAMLSVLAIPVVIKVRHFSFLRKIPLILATIEYLTSLSKAKVALGYSLLITLAHWVLLGLGAWVIAQGMDLGISPAVTTITILGALYFITSMPALPAGIGTFEFAVVYVLKLFDVDQEAAFSFAIVVHAVVFLPPVVVAIGLFSSIGLNPCKQEGQTENPPASSSPLLANRAIGGGE